MTPEPARLADLDAIRALLQSSALPHEDLTGGHLRHFVVLRDGSALAGIGGLEVHGSHGLLRSVAVPAQRREQGRGSALVATLEANARTLGLQSLYLLTTTAADYFAQRGYERIARGTAPAGIQRSAEFSTLCPSTAICMVKALS